MRCSASVRVAVPAVLRHAERSYFYHGLLGGLTTWSYHARRVDVPLVRPPARPLSDPHGISTPYQSYRGNRRGYLEGWVLVSIADIDGNRLEIRGGRLT